MSTVADAMAAKGNSLITVRESATVLEATRRMNDYRVGSVAVVDGEGRLVGIFTERDVLRRVVVMRRDPETTSVTEVMTQQLVTCDPSDDLDDLAGLMRDHRIRHIPCVDRRTGRLCGMVSIGDVNAYHVGQVEAQVQQLSEYVYGRA